MVKNIATFLLSICFAGGINSAMGQTVVQSVTQMSSNINSEAEEILPMLSQTGDSLFFARIFHENNKGGLYSGSDIWMSIYDNTDKTWQPASNQLNGWNDKRNNFIVGTRAHEKVLYMNHPKSPEKGIQFVKKVNGDWTEPETLSIPGIPNTGYQGLYVSAEYDIILISMRNEKSLGEEDLFVVTKNNNGKWEKPVNLGSTINTSASEISPFLSKDKKTLYFASKGHGGFGDMDIFKADRLYNSWTVWSKPVNMGDQINSEAFDAYYTQYGDTLGFFSSNREGELADIYEVKLGQATRKSSIDELVQKNENKELLNNSEITDIFGFVPDNEIKFEKNSDQILASSTELLYFIANTLINYSDIYIMLVANNNETTVLAGNRLTRASINLQNNGVSPRRIQLEITPKIKTNASGDDKISFYLYRLNDN